jgi:hypothetical protein
MQNMSRFILILIITLIKNLTMKKGDRIFFRTQGLTRFDHHGIYCGNNEVIHLDGLNLVCKDNLDVFLGNKNRDGSVKNLQILGIADISVVASDSPKDVIQRAEDYYEGRKSFGGYNLVFNNCEHFATWCQTGVAQSKQVLDVAENTKHVGTNLQSARHHRASILPSSPTMVNVAKVVINATPSQLKVFPAAATLVVGGLYFTALGIEKGIGALGTGLKYLEEKRREKKD